MAASKKIVKKDGKKLTEIEKQVVTELQNLEASGSEDLKNELKDLHIVAVKEIEGGKGNKKAVVIFVPFKFQKAFQRIQTKLVRELEKKFAEKHVIIVAERTILGMGYSRQKGASIRPRSRTLAAVQEAILEDIVYPTEIVGKRTRVSEGRKLLKVLLDPKDEVSIDTKLATFETVYTALTHKAVKFEFPSA